MNADLKRVRDTSLDPAPSPSKRRALAAPGGTSPKSPGAEMEDDGLEEWQRVVEVKRKEAIYRQMLDYRRSYEREAARASALEQQKRNHEAARRSVEACWRQLVSLMRDRIGKPDEAQEVLDYPSRPEELDGTLQLRLSATQKLLGIFADVASGNSTHSTDLSKQLSQLQAESCAQRANADQLQAQVAELRQSRDSMLHDLSRAQKRLDKQRMEFDREREQWQTQAVREPSAKPMANGSGHSTPNARASEQPEAKPVQGGVATSLETEQRAAELEQLAASRLKQNEALRQELLAVTQEVDKLRLLAHHPSEAALREAPFFQVYLQQLATETSARKALQEHNAATEQKLDQLRDSNLEFREAVLAEARAEADALRAQIVKKDADLARLRGQRDDITAELTERKAKDVEKARFAAEMEAQSNSRQERISYLVAEVRRLKSALAARDGAGSYLAFLKGDGGIDGDYVKDLEERLKVAEAKVAAALSDGGDVAAARAELEEVKALVAKYQRILGPNASGEAADLAAKLKAEVEARTKLELQHAEAEEAMNSLYSELEGVTKLWEGLDQTLRTKVFELKDGELRMQRLSTEKAKADNKFFQAMRTKEAIDVECKTAQRTVEKQLKLLERAQEVERSLTSQIAQHDKGLTATKNSLNELQTQLATATSEKRQLELRLQQSQAALAEAQTMASERSTQAVTEKGVREKLADELEIASQKLKKYKEKQDALAKESAATNLSQEELSIREERQKLLKILRCSCCSINFKQQVIVKCMHTFCKDCLDQRIASRQRKCPACGLAFAKEDCQTLYWQ